MFLKEIDFNEMYFKKKTIMDIKKLYFKEKTIMDFRQKKL